MEERTSFIPTIEDEPVEVDVVEAGPTTEPPPPVCRLCGKPVGPVRRLSSSFCSRRCSSKFERSKSELEKKCIEVERELSNVRPPPFDDGCRNWLHHRAHLVRELHQTKRELRKYA